jgi:hypothetical protein
MPFMTPEQALLQAQTTTKLVVFEQLATPGGWYTATALPDGRIIHKLYSNESGKLLKQWIEES